MSTDTGTPHTKPRRLGGPRRTVSTRLEATEPEAPPRSTPPPAEPEPQRAPHVEPPAAEPKRPANGTGERPASGVRYDQLERKEARFREDQVEELNRLARQLAKQARKRRPAGTKPERITDNTLIRVAVDLLLSQSGRLRGTTEVELRKSVGLKQ